MTTAAETQDRLHRAEVTAKRIGICLRKLWELTHAGEIAHVRIGRAVRYSDADIQAFIDANRRPARTP